MDLYVMGYAIAYPLLVGLSLIHIYYKKLIDYLDYRSSAQILMNHHLETDVINMEGYAYGVEFQVKKQVGKLNGRCV